MSEPYESIRAEVEAIWGRHKSLRAQLCVSVDESYARAMTTARRWFEDGFEGLGGAFWEAALRSAADGLDAMTGISRRVPGAVSVELYCRLNKDGPVHRWREDGDLGGNVTYSPEAWEELLQWLGRVPWSVALGCAANGNDGDTDASWLDVWAHRVNSAGMTWWHLTVKGSPDTVLAERQTALRTFLRGVAEGANPIHGEISWGNSVSQCVYEEATNSYPDQTLPKGRWALRGYAWVTIMPEEIGVRLGGLNALRGSGAFVEVEHLGAGGFWCRATEGPEEFDQAAAERVFDVIAPALPPGRPNMRSVYPPNVLAFRDPAETEVQNPWAETS